MRRLISWLLVITICILLVGCGSETDDRIRMPSSSSDYKGANYQDVLAELQGAGFTNVESEVIDDLIIGWLIKDGEVEEVEVNGYTTFSTDSKYSKDVKIVVSYHTFPEEESEEAAKETEITGQTEEVDKETERIEEAPSAPSTVPPENNGFDPTESGKFRLINVDGGDTSGDRASMVVVDVGFGEREYWAYTNEHGQLVRVIAAKIVIQDGSNEPVNADGRYYDDEAKVLGTERADLDEGHVIADSLGGVSNAYNITPQDSVMNRHGDQAYMEKVIRDAGGCTDFEAIITYPDTKTKIPSHYKYTYTLQGNVTVDSFDNVNPDVANQAINEPAPTPTPTSEATQEPSPSADEDISAIDTNGNGKVTIAEAKAAGFKMPITQEHWLYKYMDDRDGDGMVGE